MAAAEPSSEDLIPDFCGWRPVVAVAFIMAMVAVVLTLAAGMTGDPTRRFLLTLLYLQWSGFCSAAVLCHARTRLRRAPPRVVFAACWALLVAVSVAVSAIGYQVLYHFWAHPDALTPEPRSSFVFRHACIASVVSLLALNYFWLLQRWRAQVRAEGESRYQALQARIRPHFLFNSLNSIATLIAVRPDDAEALVEDLSELMRAGLEVRSRLVPLADELALVRAYLRIEQTRLGERLTVEWEVPDDTLSVPVPLLSVQPLVENAIYHGIERLTAPGVVRVVARHGRGGSATGLVLEVWNPRVDTGTAGRSSGQRMAVNNIAQRLTLIYGDEAAVELGEEGERYVARLRLPAVLDAGATAAVPETA